MATVTIYAVGDNVVTRLGPGKITWISKDKLHANVKLFGKQRVYLTTIARLKLATATDLAGQVLT
jgi:hypothetical protein